MVWFLPGLHSRASFSTREFPQVARPSSPSVSPCLPGDLFGCVIPLSIHADHHALPWRSSFKQQASA